MEVEVVEGMVAVVSGKAWGKEAEEVVEGMVAVVSGKAWGKASAWGLGAQSELALGSASGKELGRELGKGLGTALDMVSLVQALGMELGTALGMASLAVDMALGMAASWVSLPPTPRTPPRHQLAQRAQPGTLGVAGAPPIAATVKRAWLHVLKLWNKL